MLLQCRDCTYKSKGDKCTKSIKKGCGAPNWKGDGNCDDNKYISIHLRERLGSTRFFLCNIVKNICKTYFLCFWTATTQGVIGMGVIAAAPKILLTAKNANAGTARM